MTKINDSFEQIKSFVKDLSLPCHGIDPLDQASISLYRRFHALLVWQLVFDNKDDVKSSGHFDEFLSDISSSYFLYITCAYKASQVLLRSSLENFIRAILIARGVKTTEIESVWELFEVAKAHFKQREIDAVVHRIGATHSKYGELCKIVHSVAYEYMSLRVPFSTIFEFSPEVSVKCETNMSNLFKIMLEILYLCHNTELDKLHYKSADIIKDAVSSSIKAIAHSA